MYSSPSGNLVIQETCTRSKCPRLTVLVHTASIPMSSLSHKWLLFYRVYGPHLMDLTSIARCVMIFCQQPLFRQQSASSLDHARLVWHDPPKTDLDICRRSCAFATKPCSRYSSLSLSVKYGETQTLSLIGLLPTFIVIASLRQGGNTSLLQTLNIFLPRVAVARRRAARRVRRSGEPGPAPTR